jgi:hypothetical protein
MNDSQRWIVVCVFAVGAAACTPLPPTVTPGAPRVPGVDSQVIEIPMGTQPAGAAPVPGGPIVIDQLVPYRDTDGAFSLQVPNGWTDSRQPAADPGSDIKLGVVFQPPGGTGLITITQFDNGQVPESVGSAANSVIELTGWRDQPGYQEIAREAVLDSEGNAMRLEIAYTRSNGVEMHSLVLFRIDGTTFSMVHAGVETDDWLENEGAIRDILDTYQVPAAPAGPSAG